MTSPSESNAIPSKVYLAVRSWDNWESDIGERFLGAFTTLEGAKRFCEEKYRGDEPVWRDYTYGSSWTLDTRRQDSIDIELTEVGP